MPFTFFQAMVLGVLAQHSLPLSMAPVLVEVANDKKALGHLSMNRATASYKMKYGMAETFQQRTLRNIQSKPFSLNIDESTTNNNMQILAMLVSYFSDVEKIVVVEHLTSLSVVKVDASSLFEVLSELFKKFEIPWANLCSILMDSCSVMRGSKSGLETRLRTQKAHHLLDIDGDACHHIHNASKKIDTPFDNWVEQLFLDLYNHFKWSTDLRSWLKEICALMGVTFTVPDRFLSHRWLSCYDVATSTLRLFEAYEVFFYACLPTSLLCCKSRNPKKQECSSRGPEEDCKDCV